MKRGIVSLALAIACAAISIAQNINVLVNGEPVRFQGVGAQQVNGRVLVPLRGVMERLGAYVGYEPAGRIVTATKGDVDLQLRIGERTARVNGRDVTLDVPAQEVRGSTLVPLRFMSEALGADVRWDAPTSSVMITTSDATTGLANPPIGSTPPTGSHAQPGNVSITSFDIDSNGYLRAGSTINFTLVGTAGGTASVQIPGVIKDIALSESSPGRYTGTYTVPNDRDRPITVSKANAIGRLRVGNVDRLIQAGNSLQIDSQAPVITATTPEANARINRLKPNITAVFDDEGGTGVEPSSVRVMLDNRDVTGEATITSNLMVFRPDQNLASGRHDVEVSARDRAGNPVSKRWSFDVEQGTDVIRSFTMTGPDNPQPGDELTFTLVGQPGGTASFTIGDRVRASAMREVDPGRYVANYTIRRGDQFDNVVAVARLKTAGGETYTSEANRGLGVRLAGVLEPPHLSTPTDADMKGHTLVLRGTAAPGARVQIQISYSQTVLGAFKMNGNVADVVVDADDRGNFVTKAIDLDTGLGRSSITYTITAATLGANDQKSEATKLTLKRG